MCVKEVAIDIDVFYLSVTKYSEFSAQDFPQCLVTAAFSFYEALKKSP